MTPFDADHPCETCIHTYEEHLGERGSCAGLVVVAGGREIVCMCTEFEPVDLEAAQ